MYYNEILTQSKLFFKLCRPVFNKMNIILRYCIQMRDLIIQKQLRDLKRSLPRKTRL